MSIMARLQAQFLCCLMLASVGQMNGQQKRSSFLSLTVGDNIQLCCDSTGDRNIGAKLYWYKQSLGRKPELVSSFLKYDQKSEFHGEFRRSNRVKLDNDIGKNDLYISGAIVSDSAVYHCVRCFLHQTEFLESYTVIVKSLNVQTKVHQPPHEETEEGRSVTLNCSVHTGSCGGKPGVHWFKQSEESAAGVLYSNGGGEGDRCEETTDSPTNSCVYSLPIHNVSSEQTGTYYCAVTACGQVLFGNGTKVKIKDVGLVVYVLSGALAFSSVLIVVLVISLCRMKKRYSSLCTELKCQPRTAAATRGEDVTQEVDPLNYAALNIHPASQRLRFTEQTGCVYSSVHRD